MTVIRLPKAAADLVAIAEIIRNPEALDKAVAAIKLAASEAEAKTAELEEVTQRVNEITAKEDELNQRAMVLDAREKGLNSRAAEQIAKEIQQTLLTQKIQDEKNDLVIQAEALAQKVADVEAKWNELIKKEADLNVRMEEARNAAKIATDQYEKYKKANDKLKNIVTEDA